MSLFDGAAIGLFTGMLSTRNGARIGWNARLIKNTIIRP
jgi:hypothetical protein